MQDRSESTNNYVTELKNDFRKFLYVCWLTVGLPEPTKVQYDIAYFLQYGGQPEDGSKVSRRMIQAFRGVGKSWITSAYCCWLLLRNPDEKILVVSASKVRSDDFSIFTKRLIFEVPVLRHLLAKDDQRNSNVAFDVGPAKPAHAPSVKSVGITGQLTGSRATRIIADDIESLNNSLTQTQRDKLGEVIKEFDAIIQPDKAAEVTYLGTPQSEESLYNKLPERGYVFRIWPARYPLLNNLDKYKGKLAPFIIQDLENNKAKPLDPTDPKRFNDFDLIAREASYGRSGFALQFMLDTSQSDANRYPLKLSDLIVIPGDVSMTAPIKLTWASSLEHRLPLESVGLTGDYYHKPMWMSDEWSDMQGKVMAIDPSGRGADECAYAVVGHMYGSLYLLASGGFKSGYDDTTLNGLATVARNLGVNGVIIEENFGDGMFTSLFRPVLARIHPRCLIDPDGFKTHIRKEARIIDTLEPVMNQHRLIVAESVVKKDRQEENPYNQLFYQMTRLTKEKGSLRHDDRLDALAIAVWFWSERLSRDQQRVVDEHRDKLMDVEIAKYLMYINGTLLGEPSMEPPRHNMNQLEF